jgi:hypothetical protein
LFFDFSISFVDVLLGWVLYVFHFVLVIVVEGEAPALRCFDIAWEVRRRRGKGKEERQR